MARKSNVDLSIGEAQKSIREGRDEGSSVASSLIATVGYDAAKDVLGRLIDGYPGAPSLRMYGYIDGFMNEIVEATGAPAGSSPR